MDAGIGASYSRWRHCWEKPWRITKRHLGQCQSIVYAKYTRQFTQRTSYKFDFILHHRVSFDRASSLSRTDK